MYRRLGWITTPTRLATRILANPAAATNAWITTPTRLVAARLTPAVRIAQAMASQAAPATPMVSTATLPAQEYPTSPSPPLTSIPFTAPAPAPIPFSSGGGGGGGGGGGMPSAESMAPPTAAPAGKMSPMLLLALAAGALFLFRRH